MMMKRNNSKYGFCFNAFIVKKRPCHCKQCTFKLNGSASSWKKKGAIYINCFKSNLSGAITKQISFPTRTDHNFH